MFKQETIYRIMKMALGLGLGALISLRIGAYILCVRKNNLAAYS